MKKMSNRLVSKLIGGVLATSLATAGLIGLMSRNLVYNHDPNKATGKTDMSTQELVSAIKNGVYCEYSLGENSFFSKEVKSKCSAYEPRLESIKRKLGLENGDIKPYLMSKGILHANYPSDGPKGEIESLYIGKILDKIRRNGANIYLTKLADKDFKGVDTYDGWKFKRGFIGTFRDFDKKSAINIEIGSIEKEARQTAKDWDQYVKSDKAFRDGSSKCNPDKEFIFNALYKIPQNKIQIAYINQSVNGIISHEMSHISDKKSEREYSVVKKNISRAIDDELKAYLTELQTTPIALVDLYQISSSTENYGSDSEIYREVAKRIIFGLSDEQKDLSDAKQFVCSLSKNEISKRSKKLYNRMFQ